MTTQTTTQHRPTLRDLSEGDQTAARELYLFTVNDGDTYRRHARPYVENQAEHLARGRFAYAAALRGWARVAEPGAKAYHREHGDRGTAWYAMFPPAVRQGTALLLARHYAEEVADHAADLIGPEEVSVTARDFDHDTFGNPTAHYDVDGRQVTRRRVQTGYSEERMDPAGDMLERAGYRPQWYKMDRIEGHRSNGAVYAVFRRPSDDWLRDIVNGRGPLAK